MTKIRLTLLILMLLTTIKSEGKIFNDSINFNKKSEILTNAVGWAFDKKTQDWVDYPNMINSNKVHKDLTKEEYLIHDSYQRFIDLQTRRLDVGGKCYYILIVNNWVNTYKRSILKRDNNSFKMKTLYAFTEEQFEKFRTLSANSDVSVCSFESIELKPRMDRSDETILKILNASLSKERLSYTPTSIMHVKKDSDNKVHFLLPYELEGSKDLSDFKNNYFSTSFEEFSKLLIQ